MAVDNAFWITRCAARVTHACRQVFVGDIEFNTWSSFEQLFIVVHLETLDRIGNIALTVVHDHQMFDSGKRWQERCDQSK